MYLLKFFPEIYLKDKETYFYVDGQYEKHVLPGSGS